MSCIHYGKNVQKYQDIMILHSNNSIPGMKLHCPKYSLMCIYTGVGSLVSYYTPPLCTEFSALKHHTATYCQW